MLHSRLVIAFLVLSASSLAATAQDTAAPSHGAEAPSKAASHSRAPAKAAPSEAAISTKSYGDWALRCREGGSAHLCEISQTIEAKGHAGAIAKISVGRPKDSDSLHAVVILPTNVSFPSSVHVRTGKDDKWGVELDWQRCIPGGCFADAALSGATLQHWHSLNSQGEIVFTDAAGDEVSLPMTFHGFGEALDAFKK